MGLSLKAALTIESTLFFNHVSEAAIKSCAHARTLHHKLTRQSQAVSLHALIGMPRFTTTSGDGFELRIQTLHQGATSVNGHHEKMSTPLSPALHRHGHPHLVVLSTIPDQVPCRVRHPSIYTRARETLVINCGDLLCPMEWTLHGTLCV